MFKKIAVIVVGWAFLLLGIVGLFLPILQGVLFILIGLIILSTEYVWAHRLLTRLKTKFPRLGRAADTASEKATAWMKRISSHQSAN
ncbi:MAG TPA: PGPGW domain-containing protein [Terriglobales bacterium]|nr:PGPGW domain-containing protein [Terriglobales bacterium]